MRGGGFLSPRLSHTRRMLRLACGQSGIRSRSGVASRCGDVSTDFAAAPNPRPSASTSLFYDDLVERCGSPSRHGHGSTVGVRSSGRGAALSDGPVGLGQSSHRSRRLVRHTYDCIDDPVLIHSPVAPAAVRTVGNSLYRQHETGCVTRCWLWQQLLLLANSAILELTNCHRVNSRS